MNILICANQDIYTNILLNHLLRDIGHHSISILFSTRIGGQKKQRSPFVDYLKLIEQDLPVQFHFPKCEAQAGQSDSELQTFIQLGKRYNITMQTVTHINQPAGVELVDSLSPDLIISVRFGQILKEAVIQIPKLGVINLHSGLLPEYRGVLATLWSLLHGEGYYGYTLHRITDAGIDTGDIIQRQVLKAKPNQSLFCHIRSIYPLAARSLAEAVHKLDAGQALPSQPQAPEQGTYYSFPETEHFEQLLAKGYPLVDEQAYAQLLRAYQTATTTIPADALPTAPIGGITPVENAVSS